MSKNILTPLDIEKKEFSIGFRGYNTAEVRAFLELVAVELESCMKENKTLREKLATIETEHRQLKELEDQIQKTLLLAQSAAEETKQNARQEATLLLREAEMERARIVSEIERLKSERDAFVAQLLSLVESFRAKFSESSSFFSKAVVEEQAK
ncbi:MAG TPA: DivIVA domain-containing protein [Fimbriimonadales bacterium]|nr:DivIVA domain-containing protein [Fimbriimonadales bacterium]